MTAPVITCPACQQATQGKFCSNCGVALESRPCHVCGAELRAGARFCHLCGVPLGQGQRRPGRLGGAWIVAGVTAVAVVVGIGARMMSDTRPTLPAPRAAAATTMSPPDISRMTPRERADRLFERIMIAEEQGFQDTVDFFTPMALQAYEMVGALDADARYHVGLIQGLQGNVGAVRAQVDSIRQVDPNHLLASMLEYTLHRLTGDSVGINASYRSFLRDYQGEIGTDKQEYQAHRSAIDAFRREAMQATSRSAGSTGQGPGAGR
jgi:Double zinc ribbon